MKKILSVLFFGASVLATAQSIEGTWEAVSDFDGKKVRSVAIFAGGFQALAVFRF